MYRENLPPSCPIDDSEPPSELVVFRLVSQVPPSDADFDSQAKLGSFNINGKPDQLVCRAFGCSVFTKLTSARRAQKLPKLKHLQHVVKLTLTPDSGRVHTKDGDHHDWWLSSTCDVHALIDGVA